MAQPPEAKHVVTAAEVIINNTSRQITISPTLRELTIRDLENLPPDHSGTSTPIKDPNHIAHTIYDRFRNQLSTLRLNGREIDFITNTLVPYSESEKEEFLEARTAGAMAQYAGKFPKASQNELTAYERHAMYLSKIQLEMREQEVKELHNSYEAAGGQRRQSYREKAGLFGNDNG